MKMIRTIRRSTVGVPELTADETRYAMNALNRVKRRAIDTGEKHFVYFTFEGRLMKKSTAGVLTPLIGKLIGNLSTFFKKGGQELVAILLEK